jgi:VanZ family protein
MLITASVSILYGAFDEYHQLFTPLRQADFYDLMADAVGVLIAQGVIFGKVYIKTP